MTYRDSRYSRDAQRAFSNWAWEEKAKAALNLYGETGVFNGHASTQNADVRDRAGGHVSGTVTYEEIEIEAGRGISGKIGQAGATNADRISLSA
jgi:hypothetical protein